MADYLKKFETTEEYEEYIDGDFLKPNVSYLIDNNQVRYNPVPPSRDGVLFNNILATEFMAATWQGKLVTSTYYGQQCVAPTQDTVDYYIANNYTFGQIDVGNNRRYPITQLKFEDGTAVQPDDCIDVSQVPADADIFIGFEPKFVVELT